jgi:hypothetical protein
MVCLIMQYASDVDCLVSLGNSPDRIRTCINDPVCNTGATTNFATGLSCELHLACRFHSVCMVRKDRIGFHILCCFLFVQHPNRFAGLVAQYQQSYDHSTRIASACSPTTNQQRTSSCQRNGRCIWNAIHAIVVLFTKFIVGFKAIYHRWHRKLIGPHMQPLIDLQR